ncbi:MAG TPA: zinc-dependent alcohol dehydrogenase family protein [Chloroflexia bacterium]|nr:zinc-dependent alcohol dehydrogenase family protein [Chloroflexia bacterium]
MRAVMYREFAQPLFIENLPDPTPPPHGVVVGVRATGLCRSDWHGWMGHDPDITLPHVPGHELAGVVEAVGKEVTRWKVGDRVTMPFVCGCGTCPQCLSGNHQVCDHQFQPGFTHWGSFARYVAIHYADINLVRLPEELDYVTAASLGCRFATSFRAVVDQGKVSGGQWVAVHGCGGVGLSAIMIASALGANVVAVDITEEKLGFARSNGAIATVNSATTPDVVQAVKEITQGGAHVSIDALGHPVICFNSIANLRKRGKHVQVGLMVAEQRHPTIPMDRVIANELEILGSHGMQAYRYPAMLQMIQAGKLHPEKLVGKTITLDQAVSELPDLNNFRGTGVTVIDRF